MRSLLLITFMILVAPSCLGATASSNRTGQTKSCTDAQANAADNAIDNLNSWAAAYRWFKEFRGCDDGAIGEGYSEAIAQLLTKRWKQLPVLQRLVLKDKSFQKFTLLHIDATLSDEELNGIVQNARHRCPSANSHLCSLIENRAKSSLAESQ